MHVPDGILPPSVIVGGYAVTAATTWYSLRRIRRQGDPSARIPTASMFTAAFLVLGWIHVPVPPVSVHLILNGLLGVVLGWYAFPAILVGLFLQAVLFGHGGLTSLGVNAAMMGLPALLAHAIFRMRELGAGRPLWTGTLGFLGGFAGLVSAAAILFVLLVTTVPTTMDAAVERAAVLGLVLAHIPLGVIEGAVTAVVVVFLLRVRPALLDPNPALSGRRT